MATIKFYNRRTETRPANARSYSFTNRYKGWENTNSIEALRDEAAALPDNCIIIDFSYNPMNGSGCVTYVANIIEKPDLQYHHTKEA